MMLATLVIGLAVRSFGPTPATACTLSVDLGSAHDRRPITGRVAGLLNGVNLTQPGDALIAPLGLTMWRGPPASWLWNRTGCGGLRTCCTLESCEPPFAEAGRLQGLGLRQQYILDGLHLGVGACEWHSFHDNPHNCSLPGGPHDEAFTDWEYTVEAAAAAALRANITTPYFDVWNEPNGKDKVECLSTTKCPYDANLTQHAFFSLYDRAHAVLRRAAPSAKVVAPSIADGGPGVFGFEGSVFPWLQQFLLHTHAAGTLPDVLTWHVSMVGSNASMLEGQHAQLKAWAAEQAIPLPPIGHNEIIDPEHTLDPAVNLAFLSTLERLGVEHSCRACWTDSVTKQSPCNDNSLDALLTDDCLANHSLGPNKPYAPPCEPAYAPRSNYHVFAWFAQLAASNGQLTPLSYSSGGSSCGGVIDGVAAVFPSAAGDTVRVLVASVAAPKGNAGSSLPSSGANATTPILLNLTGLSGAGGSLATVDIDAWQVVGTGREAAPQPKQIIQALTLQADAAGTVGLPLALKAGDAYRIDCRVRGST